MRTVLKIFAGLVVLVGLLGAGVLIWASSKNREILSRTIPTHGYAFPIPVHLTPEEAEQARQERVAAGGNATPLTEAELTALAMERAVERGRHLVTSRYACGVCHGEDFSGGVMVDDPLIGRLLGPNLTGGQGGRTATYVAGDWDRIVRHGVLPDGRPAAMPSEDFKRMSDQELSDIVTYISSRPPVDATVPPVEFGPLGKVLLATGKLPLSADMIEDHESPHAVIPPPTEASVAFGEHLAAVCMGCHRSDLTGGPILGGAPNWPPAANLTPHVDGLAGWTYEDFTISLLEGRRPDGTEILPPMSEVRPLAANMTDVELRALWAYLQSVQARPTAQ